MRAFRTPALIAALGLSAVLAAPASAHHSAAMFDAAKVQEVRGQVTAVEWTNPHAWLSVRSTGAEPAAAWHFELPGPGALARMGFSQAMFAPGAAVMVSHRPLRDGRRGGQLLTVTFADGRTLRAAGTP